MSLLDNREYVNFQNMHLVSVIKNMVEETFGVSACGDVDNMTVTVCGVSLDDVREWVYGLNFGVFIHDVEFGAVLDDEGDFLCDDVDCVVLYLCYLCRVF